jgi:hypothetical protein
VLRRLIRKGVVVSRRRTRRVQETPSQFVAVQVAARACGAIVFPASSARTRQAPASRIAWISAATDSASTRPLWEVRYATTHDPRVEVHLAGLGMSDHDRDDSVVTEPVATQLDS